MIIGADEKIRITLKDQNGTPFDTGDLDGCIIEFTQKNFDIQKFSLNPLAGHTDLVIEDAVNGIVLCPILGANTLAGFKDKEVYVSVKIQYADTDFPGDLTMIDSGNIWFDTMRDSSQKDVNTFS